MKNFYLTSFILLMSMFCSLSLPASEKESNCCECEPGYIIDEQKMLSGYNAPEMLCLNCPYGLFFEGAFIYAQPREGGLNMALISRSNEKSRLVKMPFSYEPGFFIATGISAKKESWGLGLKYTRLDEKTDLHKESKENLIPLWTISTFEKSNQSVNAVSGLWQINYNVLDLTFFRPYYVGLKFTLKPSFGLKGGWIDQKCAAKYTTYNEVPFENLLFQVRVSSKSWFVGPMAEAKVTFIMGKGIDLFAQAAAALIYQHFDLSFKEEVESFFAKDELKIVNPYMDMGLGFSWGYYFPGSKSHLKLSLSYDINIFFDQNFLCSFKDMIKNYIDGASGDLVIHGFTIAARIDF